MMINVSIVWYLESLTNTTTSCLLNLVKTKARSQSTVLHLEGLLKEVHTLGWDGE